MSDWISIGFSSLWEILLMQDFPLSVSVVSHLHSHVICIPDTLSVMFDVLNSEKITCTGVTRENK